MHFISAEIIDGRNDNKADLSQHLTYTQQVSDWSTVLVSLVIFRVLPKPKS